MQRRCTAAVTLIQQVMAGVRGLQRRCASVDQAAASYAAATDMALQHTDATSRRSQELMEQVHTTTSSSTHHNHPPTHHLLLPPLPPLPPVRRKSMCAHTCICTAW